MARKKDAVDAKKTFDKLNNCYVNVTWKTLHETIYLPFASDAIKKNNHEFIEFMFPNLYDSITRGQGSYVTYFREASDKAAPRFKTVFEHLNEQKNSAGEHFTYENSPFISDLSKKWDECILFSGLSEEKRGELDEALTEIIVSFSHDDPQSVEMRLSSLMAKNKQSQVLACLSVIASTLFYWPTKGGKALPDCLWLYNLALPPLPETEGSYNLQCARDIVKNARDTIDTIKLNNTIDNLKKTLKDSLNNNEKGEANYLIAQLYFQLYLISQRYSQLSNTNIYKSKYQKYIDTAIQCGYVPAVRYKNEKEAERLLSEIDSLFKKVKGEEADDLFAVEVETLSTENSIIKCICQKCERILLFSPAVSDTIRGKASFILYLYINSNQYTSTSGESANKYLELSNNCGFSAATKLWKNHNPFLIAPQVNPSESTTDGICFVNCSNHVSNVFGRSIPKNWKMVELDADNNICANLKKHIDKRILLISDNFTKNLHDALDVLQLIKDIGLDGYSGGLEIFLRTDAENAPSIIDTALSHMPEYHIPVYIIDDDKVSAQQLLSKHPLFYPLKFVNLNKFNAVSIDEKPTLHFVVLGSTRTAEWLVREAFWMMGFKNNTVNSKISVFAPDGEQFVTDIKSRFPGMASDRINIPDIPLPDISGYDADLNSFETLNRIKEITSQKKTYYYFSVATNCDENNLTIAKRLREMLIRNQISSKSNGSLESTIPIAFLCRDEYTACISRGLVVEIEDLGNKWFNTWALIPFGEWSQSYTWDNIDGGTFEQLSKCIHLQFYGIEPENAAMESENTQKAVYEYFRRQYNRDSSYSLALSMPYRIFQHNDTYGNNITPLAWSILDPTAFATVEQLKQLSGRLGRSSKSETETKSIAKWEHDRWVKWMLSRGWLPSSPKEAVFAFKCGNVRHQLFVARLHPCICSYDSLKELSELLLQECGIAKNFYKSDIENIECTERLLRLEWIKTKEEEIGDDRL